ncbi:hypothetical protein DN752_16875 [Echinicola strongylocentroti]|uniref:Uncharacterized protein n=1 Tax=Echinicola strongylocentroti TaxID=1795355 RepID=A0A2Z4IL41_9BACT|nr:hypothetical protein [Echinicola strongylocentroti]AWW31665.1 hypothetical protein DN752_16875 [Echinicola strongylocentroti]
MKPHASHFLKMSFSYVCMVVGTALSWMAVGGKIPGFDFFVYILWGFIAIAYAREVVIFLKKEKDAKGNNY